MGKKNTKNYKVLIFPLLLVMAILLSHYKVHAAKYDYIPDPPASNINVSDHFILSKGSNISKYENVAFITKKNKHGALWTSEKINLNNPFTYKANIYTGPNLNKTKNNTKHKNPEAGLTFTIQNDPSGPNVIDYKDSLLGIYDKNTQIFSPIKNAISFEIDLFSNPSDPRSKHAAFVDPANHTKHINHADLSDFNWDYSGWNEVIVRWEPEDDESGTMLVLVNDVPNSYKVSNYINFFNGDSVHFGYTGSINEFTSPQVIAINEIPQLAHNLSFNLNGLPGGTPPTQKIFSGQLGQTIEIPERIGYTFLGWNTASDGSGQMWDLSTNIMPDHDIKLYALWQKDSHQLNFEINVNGNNTLIEPQFISFGEKAIPVIPDICPCQKFINWNTAPDGSGTIWNFNTSTMPDHETTLYAQWEEVKYHLHFDLNGSRGTKLESKLLHNGILDTPIPEPLYIGHHFIGWNTKIDGSGIALENIINQIPEENLTLYAQWEEIKYLIDFDLNGVDGQPPDQQALPYGSLSSVVNEPANMGYTFIGWNTAANGTGMFWNFKNDKMVNKNITLYAQWHPNIYKLSFDLNEGLGDTPQIQQLNYNNFTEPVIDPTRQGHIFTGWNTEKDGSGQMWNFSVDTMPAKDTTLYAQWEIINYTLTFDLNNGDSDQENTQLIKYNHLAIQPKNPTRLGHIFRAWNTKKDGSGDTWIFATSAMPAENITLYAQWRPEEYALRFDVNDGTDTDPTTQKIKYGEIARKINNPTRPNYDFLGWNTAPNGTGTFWDKNQTKMPAGDMTLYATWEKIKLPKTGE